MQVQLSYSNLENQLILFELFSNAAKICRADHLHQLGH